MAQASLKDQLNQMTFEEIQKLQNKLGLKKFKEVMSEMNPESSDDESESSEPAAATTTAVAPTSFKRLNHNRPREMSSKKPVSAYRNVFQVKKQERIDPRFSAAIGEYKPEIFRKQYGFVNDMRKNEIDMLKKELKNEEDFEKKEQLKTALTRLKQQVNSFEENEKAEKMKEEYQKKMTSEAKEGKKPLFINKSEKKILQLAEKYKDLKKSGKVDKFLAKKRKKQLSKDKMRLDASKQVRFSE